MCGRDEFEYQIMVSILCLTYNHASFIRQTLEGFVKQKTTFMYEVLVHDDSSTDGTANIIREYAERYPDIIKPIYQTENQYSKRIGIINTFLLPKAQGKYLAWCEGDDYWITVDKLQTQVDVLEQNDKCVSCLSKVEKITLSGDPLNSFIPSKYNEDGVISGDEFVKYILNPGLLNGFPIQLSGFMIKCELYRQYYDEDPLYRREFKGIEDIPLALYTGVHGDIYYIDRVMSYYRTGNPNSWIGRSAQRNKEQTVAYFNQKARAYEAFDEYTNGMFHEDADKAAAYARFVALNTVHDVKHMKRGKMLELYKTLSLKARIATYLFYFCPWLEKPVRRIRSHIKK